MTSTSKPPPPTPQRLKPLLLSLRPRPLPTASAASSAAASTTPGAPSIEADAASVASYLPLSLSPRGRGASELRSSLRRLLGAPADPTTDSSAHPSCSLLVPAEYEFSRTQERAFVELDSAMTRCAARYLLLALASAAAAAVGGGSGSHASAASHYSQLPCPHTWIARAEAAQALAVSVFLWAAGEPFARIAETRGNDLLHLLTGLSETAHALLEATIMSAGLCLLFAASAAALWPRGAFPAVAAMTFAATAARATLHRHPRALPPLLEAPGTAMKALTAPLRAFNRKRRALRLRAMLRREKEKEKEEEKKEGGRMLRRAPSDAGAAAAAAAESTTPAKEREHEFTTAQEQVFRLLVRSLHVLCYARLAHAACEGLVAVAAAATGDAVGAVAAGVGALEVAATAKLFWSASAAFDRVISSSGSDIKLLLAGVASAPGSHGLAAMFEKLCHVLELALFLKVAPLALVALAGGWSFLASGGYLSLLFGTEGRLMPPAELLGSLREFAAGVGVA